MSTAIAILRAVAILLWLLAPPILTVFALRDWKRKRSSAGLRMTLPLAIATVLLTDWVLFVRFLIESETPYGTYYQTSWSTAILLLLSFVGLIASIAAPAGRWQLSLSSVLVLTLWVCIGYAPAHWLSRVDFGSVTVDGHPVGASMFIGNPTDSEAEAVLLVRLEHGGGDYFFDFGSEKVREASRSEYVRLPGGVWCFKSMQNGTFVEPFPSHELNQFRVLSRDGHIVTVQF